MARITISEDKSRVVFPEATVFDQIVIELFDQTPVDERAKLYEQIIRIGSYARVEDRIAHFLDRTQTQIGAEFEHLQLLFKAKEQAKIGTGKGVDTEHEIRRVLQQESDRRNYGDIVERTGEKTGELDAGNKTGDLLIYLESVDGPTIVVESKMDASILVGSLEEPGHDKKQKDTVWSQLVEAAANRESVFSIFVLDRNFIASTTQREVDTVAWIVAGGVAVVIDQDRGDFSALLNAYAILRGLMLSSARPDINKELLGVVVARAIAEVNRAQGIRKHVDAIKKTADKITQDLVQSHAALQSILKVLESGNPNEPIKPADLITLHQGEDVRDAIKKLKAEFTDNSESED